MNENQGDTPSFHLHHGLPAMNFAPVSSFRLITPPSIKISTACSVFPKASSLPEDVRERLMKLADQRISKDGVVIIKAQEFRSLEGNRTEAMRRLHELIDSIAVLPKRRRPTKPTRNSVRKRLEGKTRRASIKAGRGKVRE